MNRNYMFKPLFTICLLTCSIFVASQAVAGPVPEGSKIFIAPSDDGLDGFLTAEIIQEKIPVVITKDDKAADYIMVVGSSVKNKDKWWDLFAFGVASRDSQQSSVQLINPKDKTVVWSTAQGDRSPMFGLLKKRGPQKVAIRIAKDMKKDLF